MLHVGQAANENTVSEQDVADDKLAAAVGGDVDMVMEDTDAEQAADQLFQEGRSLQMKQLFAQALDRYLQVIYCADATHCSVLTAQQQCSVPATHWTYLASALAAAKVLSRRTLCISPDAPMRHIADQCKVWRRRRCILDRLCCSGCSCAAGNEGTAEGQHTIWAAVGQASRQPRLVHVQAGLATISCGGLQHCLHCDHHGPLLLGPHLPILCPTS